MKIKKPKRKSISKHQGVAVLKAKVWGLCSKYIRLRDCLRTSGTPDYGNCITCSRLVSRRDADAGHFISRRFNATLFDETNVHLQCKRCNAFGGEVLKYRLAIIRLYGEGYDVQLEDKAMGIKKFTVAELEELKDKFTQKIKELEKEG